MSAPEEYLGTAVPARIRLTWRTWAGVEWRIARHADHGNLQPPDQRFGVDIPDGMCSVHRRQWRRWRDKRFRGLVWPGPFPNGGFRSADGFRAGRHSLDVEWEQHRCWWDEQSITQMRLTEAVCLSGSRQCDGVRYVRAVAA
ncbi:hypothetical protein [Nocardia sp. NPDC003963]